MIGMVLSLLGTDRVKERSFMGLWILTHGYILHEYLLVIKLEQCVCIL